MEEFVEVFKARTGVNVGAAEAIRLYSRYFDSQRKEIDYNRLMSDIREGVISKDSALNPSDKATAKQKKPLSFDDIVDLLHRKLTSRIQTLSGDPLKNAYLLLGESRSSVVNRQQLKIACQSRLSIFLKDSEIEEIFLHLDKGRDGTINIRQLINLVLKSNSDGDNLSFTMSVNEHKSNKDRSSNNHNSYITYDNKFKDLVAPDPSHCRNYSVQEIENCIFDRIFERSNLNDNLLKTTTKLFSYGESVNGYNVITLEMLRYTLWKRLKMNVSDEDLQRFYLKHAKGPNGTILLFDFIEAIITRHPAPAPIIDDRCQLDKNKLKTAPQENQNIEYFLIYVRKKLNEMINRESRAPHYLLHGNTRMTENQAKDFLRGRLGINIDDQSVFSVQLKSAVLQEYRSNSLIDVKRILLEAMAIKEEHVRPAEDLIGTLLPNQTLLNSSTVCIDRMPLTLSKSKISPEKIEELIIQKGTERFKSDLPHASMIKLFRDAEGDSRKISRKGMRTVLYKFDIVMSPEEFEAFFAKHDRGDGYIDIQSFLRVLMPVVDVDASPFVPKDPERVKLETSLSQVMEEMTGRRHEVNWLNGPSNGRTQPEFLQTLKPSSSGMTLSSRKPSSTGISLNNTSTSLSVANNAAIPTPPLNIERNNTFSEQAEFDRRSTPDASSTNSTITSLATPASTPAGLTEQIRFAEALLKALKELPAYKKQQEFLSKQQEQKQQGSSALGSSGGLTPTAPASPAPSRQCQGPRRPLSSANSSAASSPAKPVLPVSNQGSGTLESGSSHRPVDISSNALDSVPENEELNLEESRQSAAYHLQQSEQLLALAEAYATATGVLSPNTALRTTSSSKSARSNPERIGHQKPKDQTFKINLGKPDKASAPTDTTKAADLTSMLEQASLITKSPRASNQSNAATTNKQKVHDQHRPTTAPVGSSTASFSKSSPFHVKHVKGNQPAMHPCAPPVITGIGASTLPLSNQASELAETPQGALTSRSQISEVTVWSGKTGGSKSPRGKAHSGKGANHILPVNPYSEGLLDDYRMHQKILVTSNQEYGVFVKNLNKAIRQRVKLTKKQQQNDKLSTDSSSDDEDSSMMSSSQKRGSNANKAATLTLLRNGTNARVVSVRPNTAR